MRGYTHILKATLTAFALLTTATWATADWAERYAHTKGFTAVNADTLEGDRYYSAARFPKKGASAFHPDADLPAPVRAMLLMDSHEGALPHARYLINYQPTAEAATPDDARGYVEITRFNLGPAVRADLAGSVPAEHLGDAKAFGIGPHVRWRFAMAPQRGMAAGLEAVSRMPISTQQAASMDCLGQPCTRLESSEGPKGKWKSQRIAKLPASFARTTPQGAAPASVAEHLLNLLGEDAQRGVPFAANAQRLVLVVSANPGGQEQMATGLARNALVFDDAVGTHWVRYVEVAGTAAQAHGLNQLRK